MGEQQHREAAARHRGQAQQSWERSDTDGALSQWASGQMSALEELRADIAADGGTALFPCLVDAETGELVPARIITTRYGPRWAVFASAEDANGYDGEIVEWVGTSDRALAAKGYRDADQRRPARAELAGSGRGLSGALSVRAVAVPDDGLRFAPDAEAVPR